MKKLIFILSIYTLIACTEKKTIIDTGSYTGEAYVLYDTIQPYFFDIVFVLPIVNPDIKITSKTIFTVSDSTIIGFPLGKLDMKKLRNAKKYQLKMVHLNKTTFRSLYINKVFISYKNYTKEREEIGNPLPIKDVNIDIDFNSSELLEFKILPWDGK